MIILKHVEYKIQDSNELRGLWAHLEETTSQISGVNFRDIWFLRGQCEFIVVLDCVDEDKYLAWRDICPPPPGAKDWYEILFTKDEQFPK